MVPIAWLGLALLQGPPSQVEWRSLESAGGPPQRYGLIARRDLPAQEARPLLVALARPNEVGLEATLAPAWMRKAADSGWLVAGIELSDPTESGAVRATLVADALGREFQVEGRPHLWAAAGAALDSLSLAWSAPGRFGSALIADAAPPSESALAAAPDWMEGGVAVLSRSHADDALATWDGALRALRERGATVWADHAQVFEPIDEVLLRALARIRGPEATRWQTEKEVRGALDRFHAAAARADGARYFALLAPDAVYLGTDASERWSVAQFRAFAEPYFASGRGWTYVATERHVRLAPAGDFAWFDERLQNDKYGETRGSGALRKDRAGWRIVQYNLAFPVPNELSLELVERIRASQRAAGK